MYGQRKFIAKRVPVVTSKATGLIDDTSDVSKTTADNLLVPAMTDGETGTDTELETETEAETPTNLKQRLRSKHQRCNSCGSGTDHLNSERRSDPRRKPVSQHDLFNKYFRRDTVILKNVDLLR
jgi:phosphatidylethanolamine N-methyltransferase